MVVRALVGALLILTLAARDTRSAPTSPSDESVGLHSVKKISLSRVYVPETNPEGVAQQERLITYFKDELARVGFSVVDDPSEADAVLSGQFGGWIVFDGPSYDPPKYFYEYELTQNGARVWKTSVNVRSKAVIEADRKGVRKVVLRLCRDWDKAARKSGVSELKKCV